MDSPEVQSLISPQDSSRTFKDKSNEFLTKAKTDI